MEGELHITRGMDYNSIHEVLLAARRISRPVRDQHAHQAAASTYSAPYTAYGASMGAAPDANLPDSKDLDGLWRLWAQDPNAWFDNRENKRNPKVCTTASCMTTSAICVIAESAIQGCELFIMSHSCCHAVLYMPCSTYLSLPIRLCLTNVALHTFPCPYDSHSASHSDMYIKMQRTQCANWQLQASYTAPFPCPTQPPN